MPEENPEVPSRFGAALRSARQAKGLTQQQLSKKLGYSKSQLSKIETGKARARVKFAESCGNALDAAGALMDAFDADQLSSAPATGSPPEPDPFDIPPRAGSFSGRAAEVVQVIRAITCPEESRAPAVLIYGMPGIGKTALAVHVAHLVRLQYPDGCLFLDFESSPDYGTGLAVFGWLLGRLHIPASEIPAEPGEALARYRSVLRSRRVLIVADGVTSAAQVAALVPASPTCAVIATSQRRLYALDDWQMMSLPPLDGDDASALLRAVSRRSDLGCDADVLRLAAACDGLPLALRIVATRARDSHRSAAELADLIESAPTPWTQFDDGERSTRRTIEAGLEELPERLQRILALLTLHPGEPVGPYPVAWLADSSLRSAEDDLAGLRAHGLVTGGPDRRARPHGLAGRLAAEAAANRGRNFRQQAQDRMLAGYVQAAMAADSALVATRHRPGKTGSGVPTVAPLSFADGAQAMDWCRSEADNVPRLCWLALERGLHEECWQLAYAMRDYFFAARALGPWVDSHCIALQAAERCENQWAQAATRNNLGMAYVEQNQFAEATAHYDQALTLQRALGDGPGVATTLGHQAWAHHAAGRHDQAVVLARQALELNRQRDDQRAIAITDRTAALAYSRLGQHRKALDLLAESWHLLSAGELNLPLDVAMTENCLGEVHFAQGEFKRAAECHTQAAKLSQACGGTGELARAVRGQAAAAFAGG